MEKIKVLVANQPRLMRELVMATISDQPDEIVGVLENRETSIFEMVGQRPNFSSSSITPTNGRGPDVLLRLRFPRMRIKKI